MPLDPNSSMSQAGRSAVFLFAFLLTGLAAGLLLWTPTPGNAALSPVQAVEIRQELALPFRFIAFGDTRFTDPADTQAANAPVRQGLVQAIADAQPAFISIGGDIAYNGNESADWLEYDKETAVWRDRNLPVYPALGNHDLHGIMQVCLANYFQRFPVLQESRYYSLRTANLLMLVLDSSQDEVSGSQGNWLHSQLGNLPKEVEFVAVVLHHPPYTSSSDDKLYGGGHSVRQREKDLAEYLESAQKNLHSRIVVFSSHVHNYERDEHGGVTYFVTGGGGAHAYPVERKPSDLFQSKEINYHYIMVEVEHGRLKATMNRLEIQNGQKLWTQPDTVTIVVP
jgi:acid phosphatase type 7